MLINNVSQAMQGELRKADGSRSNRPEREREVSTAQTSAATDSSELSTDGKMHREAKDDIRIISSMIKAQPDIRSDKVAEAGMKIASGFYNTEDFVGKLAAKLANTVA